MSKSCIRIENLKPSRNELKLAEWASDYWIDSPIEQRRKDIKAKYFKHFGKKQPSNARPIKQAVVLIKDSTTLEDLRALDRAIEKELGIHAFQIYIYRDKGHHDSKGVWQPNLHAYLVFDMTDKITGISYKLKRDNFFTLQDITAEALGMERGTAKKITGKKHLHTLAFKAAKEQERIDFLKTKKRDIENNLAQVKYI